MAHHPELDKYCAATLENCQSAVFTIKVKLLVQMVLGIVGLVWSGVGRVCRFGSVHVRELRFIERYATLHQNVSSIRSERAEGRDAHALATCAGRP